MGKIIKSFKGMNSKMQCRDNFQYEVGKEYETENEICLYDHGFHACKSPLDVFNFYPPNDSRYFDVEQSGESNSDDAKTVSSKIKIIAEIGIIGLVKSHIDYVLANVIKTEKINSGDCGASINSGDCGAAINSGYRGAASNSGYQGAASNSGVCGAASNSGECGIAVAWGYQSRAKLDTDTGYMVLSDWRVKNNKLVLHKAYLAKIGDVVRRKTIRKGVWYWFEEGKLRSEKSQ